MLTASAGMFEWRPAIDGVG